VSSAEVPTIRGVLANIGFKFRGTAELEARNRLPVKAWTHAAQRIVTGGAVVFIVILFLSAYRRRPQFPQTLWHASHRPLHYRPEGVQTQTRVIAVGMGALKLLHKNNDGTIPALAR
jgi:hypothetical protein